MAFCLGHHPRELSIPLGHDVISDLLVAVLQHRIFLTSNITGSLLTRTLIVGVGLAQPIVQARNSLIFAQHKMTGV